MSPHSRYAASTAVTSPDVDRLRSSLNPGARLHTPSRRYKHTLFALDYYYLNIGGDGLEGYLHVSTSSIPANMEGCNKNSGFELHANGDHKSKQKPSEKQSAREGAMKNSDVLDAILIKVVHRSYMQSQFVGI